MATDNLQDRRKFIKTVGFLGASGMLLKSSLASAELDAHNTALTVGQVIDLIIKEVPGAPFSDTVDTLKAGSRDQQVTGILSTSFATIDMIEKAIQLKANFIIAHEPTFYNHLDQTDWLEKDGVYEYKRDLLKKNGIAVWRFHDYIHTHRPDGVQEGVLSRLGWKQYADKDEPHIINLPATTLAEIIKHTKSKLGIEMVRFVGRPDLVCRKIALLPGAPGGRRQIKGLQDIKPDLLIGGEVSEWETSEYVRDAVSKGDKVGLLVLGHAVSEEMGMVWLVDWLQPKVGTIKVTHVPAGNPFRFM